MPQTGYGSKVVLANPDGSFVSAEDPIYVLLADGQEVTITDSTFNNDINKVANVSVSYAPGSTAGKLPVVLFNSDGTAFDVADVGITSIAGDPIPTASGDMAAEDFVLPVKAGLMAVNSFGDYTALNKQYVGDDLTGLSGLVVEAATYDGFGNPLESETVGQPVIGTSLLTIASTYDGFGNPIYSAGIGSAEFNQSNVGLFTNSALLGQVAGGNFDALGGAAPGDWLTNPPTGYIGLVTVTSLDAVGGVALSPAQDLNGVIYTLTSPMNAPLTLGVVAGYDPTYASIQGVTTNQGIGADYSPIGLDTNQALWGGAPVSAAQTAEYNWNFGMALDENIPAVTSLGQFAYIGSGDNTILGTSAQTIGFSDDATESALVAGADTRMMLWGFGGDVLAPAVPMGVDIEDSSQTAPIVIAGAYGYNYEDDTDRLVTVSKATEAWQNIMPAFEVGNNLRAVGSVAVTSALPANTANITGSTTTAQVVINLNYVSDGAGGWIPMTQP